MDKEKSGEIPPFPLILLKRLAIGMGIGIVLVSIVFGGIHLIWGINNADDGWVAYLLSLAGVFAVLATWLKYSKEGRKWSHEMQVYKGTMNRNKLGMRADVFDPFFELVSSYYRQLVGLALVILTLAGVGAAIYLVGENRLDFGNALFLLLGYMAVVAISFGMIVQQIENNRIFKHILKHMNEASDQGKPSNDSLLVSEISDLKKAMDSINDNLKKEQLSNRWMVHYLKTLSEKS